MTDSEMLAAIRALLPDTYSDSKDWRTGNVTERIIWLKGMLENKTEEVDRLIDILNDNQIEAQAAEIERLRGDLAKAVEALQGVRAFVRSLAPYADQGHSLAPELERACATLADLTGAQKDGN